ncbi:MAG TPA: hypothetical protein VEM58_12855, partial [Streptosporangiaceae bacterium]|nr:hypothetical protein [Streptosporangiaceae bacterium]
SFTQASQVLAIEVEDGADLLAAELSGRGLSAVRKERELLVLTAATRRSTWCATRSPTLGFR